MRGRLRHASARHQDDAMQECVKKGGREGDRDGMWGAGGGGMSSAPRPLGGSRGGGCGMRGRLRHASARRENISNICISFIILLSSLSPSCTLVHEGDRE